MSASPQELVEPLADAIGMTGGIGTVSEVDGRRLHRRAGRARSCYGPGKVDAIKEIADWEGYDLNLSTPTATRPATCPMLEAVGHPVAVNPDGALARVAHDHGWPIVIFRRRTRRVVRRTTALVGRRRRWPAAAFAGGLSARNAGKRTRAASWWRR